MATFEEETENVRDWATGFAVADRLAEIHGSLPGFGEVWTQWLGLTRRYRTSVLRHYGEPALRRRGGLETRDGVLASLDALDAALAAARGPYDAERPHVRGWARVMAAAQDVVASLPRELGHAG
jgi:hypothetical protein